MDLGPEPEVAWVCGEKEHEVAWVCGEVQAGRAPAGSAAAPVSATSISPVIYMVLAFANNSSAKSSTGEGTMRRRRVERVAWTWRSPRQARSPASEHSTPAALSASVPWSALITSSPLCPDGRGTACLVLIFDCQGLDLEAKALDPDTSSPPQGVMFT